MCDPITMAAVGAIGTAAQISAANQAAEAQQAAAIENQKIMNAQRVLQAEETKKEAAIKLTQNEREALRQKSRIKVGAAESGVAGGAVFRNLANVYTQKAISDGTITALNESDLVQIGMESQSDFMKTKNAINIAESKKTTGLAAVLQIGAGAAQGYGAGGGFNTGMTWDKSYTSFKGTWGLG